MTSSGPPSNPDISRSRRRILRLSALLAIAALALGCFAWFGASIPPRRIVRVTDVTPDAGLAYTGKFAGGQPASHDAAAALLYLVQIRAGGPLHFLHGLFASSYVFGWVEALLESRFIAHHYEQWLPLGPAGSSLDDIRQKGNGRYVIGRDRVYFSLPRGRSMGGVERVEMVVPRLPPGALDAAGRLLKLLLVAVAARLLVWVLRPALLRFGRVGANLHRLLLAGVIAVAALIGATGAAEIYFRATGRFPKSAAVLPFRFVPDVGFLYEPNAEIRWTNGLDFWTVQYTNSLGFADREPAIPKPPGTFRILLVGDSFVEALQVPPEQKLQTLLAAYLRRQFPDRRYDVVAMGHVGTGQSNQLPYIEKFGSTIAPDMVILLFIDNDFVNNSAVLEAVRRGWNLNYLPELYFRLDAQGNCQRLPISSEYLARRMPVATEAEHVAMLREIAPEEAAKLNGWDPETQSMDDMFFSEGPLPPAFEEAVSLTRCAIAAWQARARQDGFRLIAVAADNVTDGVGTPRPDAIERLKTITGKLDVPLLDLYPIFAAQGGTERTRWAHDFHWNPTGYRWAAAAIGEFLDQREYLPRAAGAPR